MERTMAVRMQLLISERLEWKLRIRMISNLIPELELQQGRPKEASMKINALPAASKPGLLAVNGDEGACRRL